MHKKLCSRKNTKQHFVLANLNNFKDVYNSHTLSHTCRCMHMYAHTYIHTYIKCLFYRRNTPAHSCEQWHTQEFCSWGGSTNSVEDRENRLLEAAVIWYKKFHFI